MDKKAFNILAAAMGVVLLGASISYAALAVPGDYQDPVGGVGDWSPGTAPLMTDLGGNLFELPLTLAGIATPTRFQFKILDDEGSAPANWGDPEIPAGDNNFFFTDASGNATITLDRNTYNDGYLPATDRITVSTDLAQFTGAAIFATGTWMNEAGGAADFVPNNPLFQMADQGGGLWSLDVTISVPGNYVWKAVNNNPGDWANQWGLNGRKIDATNFPFVTVVNNQEITFLLDIAKGAISYSTDTFLPGDTDNDGIIEFEDDFFPIRDNWLSNTFVRTDGNLNNTGDSEGIVDIADFREWKDACTLINCTTAGALVAAFASLGSQVPEPGSAMLALVAAVGLVTRIRKR